MNKYKSLAITLLLFGCSEQSDVQSDLSKSIYNALEKSDFKSIDFSVLAGGKWTKLCFFGPYSDSSDEVLGFDWRASEHTDVLRSDGHNIIVFASESDVVEYVIHNRRYGDFWKLSKKCFKRGTARFIKDSDSGNWKNYVHEKT